MYKSKETLHQEFIVSFRVVNLLIVVLFSLFSHHSAAVPESDLASRSTEIDAFYTDKVKTADFYGSGGKRLSYGYVPGDPSLPPIVVAVGLGESYSHYKEFIYDLYSSGEVRQAFFAFDLRSQGFSERLAPDKGLFHIESFDDYVQDLESFLDNIVKTDYPLVPRMIAHSTGGMIAFHLLSRRPEMAERVIFVAPLFGLNYGGAPNWLMKNIAKLLTFFGFRDKSIPFRQRADVPPFAENLLTGSEERYRRMMDVRLAFPVQDPGGPSVGFVVAAQAAIEAADPLAEKFIVPSVMLTADRDAYVSTSESRRFCSRMRSCEYVPLTDAQHVLMHERDAVRNVVFDAIKSFMVVPQTPSN